MGRIPRVRVRTWPRGIHPLYKKGSPWVLGSIMFRTPSNLLVVGPSGSGKTVFVADLLKDPQRHFRPPPKRVHYCYGAMQPLLETLRDEVGVRLHEGLPNHADLHQWFGQEGGILVLDDLMAEGGNDKEILDLFTKHSHHQNITVLYLCQDMFPREKYAKTINRQAHYIVAFKSPRDQLGVKNLLLQAFPSRWKEVLDVFDKVTRRPFGYMMLDLHPASDDALRVFSHLLEKEGITRGYCIKDDTRKDQQRLVMGTRRRTIQKRRQPLPQGGAGLFGRLLGAVARQMAKKTAAKVAKAVAQRATKAMAKKLAKSAAKKVAAGAATKYLKGV